MSGIGCIYACRTARAVKRKVNLTGYGGLSLNDNAEGLTDILGVIFKNVVEYEYVEVLTGVTLMGDITGVDLESAVVERPKSTDIVSSVLHVG